MSRTWKPGDVAMVKCDDGVWRPALYDHRGSWPNWQFGYGGRRDAGLSEARPLVVIDPEAAEEFVASALRHIAFGLELDETDRNLIAEGIDAALGEYANPTPPQPTEPADPAARAIDADMDVWASYDGKWYCLTTGYTEPKTWPDLVTNSGPLEIRP